MNAELKRSPVKAKAYGIVNIPGKGLINGAHIQLRQVLSARIINSAADSPCAHSLNLAE